MLDRERAAVEQADKSRIDPAQWNATLWEEALSRLTSAIAQRDATMQQRIDQAPIGSSEQRRHAQDLREAIEADSAWLEARKSALETFSQDRRRFAPGTAAHTDLARHQELLDLHLAERPARRAEVLTENLARQQHHTGKPDAQQWKTVREELTRAWATQQRLFEQRRMDTEPLRRQRHAWLQRLAKMLQDALPKIPEGAQRSALLAQMQDVDNEIERYKPKPLAAAAGSGAGALITILLLLLFAAAMAGGARNEDSRGGAPPVFAAPPADLGSGGSGPVAPPAEAAPAPADQGSGAPPADMPSEPIQPAAIDTLAPAAQASALILRGIELRRAGRCGEATGYFEQAIVLDPVFITSYTQLAFCLYELGRTDEAIQRWSETLRNSPSDPDALAGMGMALYTRGEHELGLARYREALAIDPRYGDETFLAAEQAWSENAVVASRPLRAPVAP